MAWKAYKDQSKRDWGQDVSGELCLEQIRTGAILRIADALEIMSRNHATLLEERDRYKNMYNTERELKHRAYRVQSALRGVITKLKKGKR